MRLTASIVAASARTRLLARDRLDREREQPVRGLLRERADAFRQVEVDLPPEDGDTPCYRGQHYSGILVVVRRNGLQRRTAERLGSDTQRRLTFMSVLRIAMMMILRIVS